MRLSPQFHNNMDRNGTWNYPWWFFATARYNQGGPAWYGEDQRMPATLYLQRTELIIISLGITFLLVLLVSLPTIKHRLHTLIAAVNSLAIGLVIGLCLVVPGWLKAHGVIKTALDYHHQRAHHLALGVYVGLASFNVTLRNEQSILEGNFADVNQSRELARTIQHPGQHKFYYNEEVLMYHPEHMEEVMTQALERGLPIPILQVYACLTSSSIGFEWSQNIVESGYHCYLILAFALTGWCITQVLIAGIPRYSCYAFIAIGIMLFATSVIYFYWSDIYDALPCIVISDVYIELRYGGCFWACLAAGIWSIIYGFSLAVYDVVHPDKFLTVFDVDYDHKRALAAAHRLNTNGGFVDRAPEFYQSTKL